MPPCTMRHVFTVLYLVLPALAQQLSDDLLSQVKQNLASGATKSWELGTRAETLLETDTSEYSVFSGGDLPPSQDVSSSSGLGDVFSIAKNVVSSLTNDTTPKPLVGQSGGAYGQAVTNQINYLYSSSVPKSSDGAISHRQNALQYWSDFVYMVPPTLAYYGIVTKNSSWLGEAYKQVRLYRDALKDSNQQNLWKHITGNADGDTVTDSGHWTTGNGWAAMGMLRVYATMKHSDYSRDFGDEQDDLNSWVKEILDGMYGHLDKGNIFANYPERKIGSGNFYDAAGTTLIAASTYRFALLAENYDHVRSAENIRKTISTQSGNSWSHFDSNGWLTPVVNPDSFSQEGNKSPEGQAFVLMMNQAWKEWKADGSKGANSATGLTTLSKTASLLFALILGMGMTVL
ncbi:glycoside hydrolase family 105 protein [Flagelloscypha sp. PMI_526]|nr:glycoside hydrolase family 105 protein [Flagelloscypha sp. PMI_526]